MQPGTSTASGKPWRSWDEARLGFERRYIILVLRKTRGCVHKAAILSGRDRSHLHRMIKQFGIVPAQYKRKHRSSRISVVAPSAPVPKRAWFGVPLQ